MYKVLFLFNTTPLPRIIRRINTLLGRYNITLVFWERCLNHDFTPEIPEGCQVCPIMLKAPLGKPWSKLIPFLRFVVRCLGVIKTVRPDIIHAANCDMLLAARLYQLRYPGVSLVYEVADLPRGAVVKALERLLMKRVDLLILTSFYFYEERYRYFYPESKVLVQRNLPPRGFFANFTGKKSAQPLTIGFIGSLRYFEQLVMLIDTAAAAAGIRLLIAGAGPDYERVHRYTLGRGYVEFYGPYNYQRDIAGLYGRVDCLYSVYDADLANVRIALPNRLYEAIACGLPLIVSRHTVLSQIVSEQGIGFVVGHQDKRELLELLVDLRDDRARLEDAAARCRELAKHYYSEDESLLIINAYKRLKGGFGDG